ncbi:hypothetical protein OAH18_03270, partial [bacterium]|nr:hypothetical protein [bacterium]
MKTRLSLVLIAVACCPMSLFAESPKLDMNDVSWLWPVPKTDAELKRVISMDSLKSEDGSTIWSAGQFADFIKTAESDAASVEGMSIDFQDEFKSMKTWQIVAFRADPCAPGGHGDIRAQLGEKPQLRLIVQPVTNSGSSFEVHDVTLHMVYSFMTADGKPDRENFARIVAGLDALKKKTEDAGVVTSGKPLGVHPGLQKNVAGLDAAVTTFLQTHLKTDNLTAMALMGLDGPEPWIFLAMSKFPPGAEHFGPVPFLPAQMLSFRGPPTVSPAPIVNNRNPMTRNFRVPLDKRRGVATAVLFNRGLDPNAFAKIGVDADGKTVFDKELKNRDIA